MMQSEFESLIGGRVTYEDYKNIIEPMYLATPENVNKVEFCKMISRKYFINRAKIGRDEG